jgi:hypothetical protein
VKTPVALLDVDGVLNALTRKPDTTVWPPDSWKSGRAQAGDGRSFLINWATDVVDWINALDDSGRVEFRWHTTWLHDAQNIADLLGLNRFALADSTAEVADGDVYSAGSNELLNARRLAGEPIWWKYGAAHRVLVEENRPLIWFDDDLSYNLPRPLRDQMRAAHPVLFIAPSEYTGIVRRHMRDVEAFLDGLELDHVNRKLAESLSSLVVPPELQAD